MAEDQNAAIEGIAKKMLRFLRSTNPAWVRLVSSVKVGDVAILGLGHGKETEEFDQRRRQA
jgi:hypothetical protein